jgi:hypothetical protein
MGGKERVEVDELDVLRQASQNFTRPLELIREAISNSYDAGANNVRIIIGRQNWEGDMRWVVKIQDDGAGMVRDETPPNRNTGSLRKFFKMGDSMRQEGNFQGFVGEKGLGIKVAFHSECLTVRTWAGPGLPMYTARCYRPWASIFKKEMPGYDWDAVEVKEKPYEGSFTEVEVVGFYDNDGSHFSADEVEDYIRWFTKWGSFEDRVRQCLINKPEMMELHLGELRPAPTGCILLSAPGAPSPRKIPFGHPFPDSGTVKIDPNERLEDVIEQIKGMPYDDMVGRLEEAKKRHWLYIIEVGTLKDIPDVNWQAIISVEGEYTKQLYNPFLRKRQSSSKFSYKAEDRYGLWMCKDFFCVQRANDIAMEVLGKEGQRTRFQILLNCQDLGTNMDRNSVGNTDANISKGIRDVAKDLVKRMIEDDSWLWTELIESEAEVRTSVRQDKLQLEKRSMEALKKPLLMIGQETIFRQPATEAETVILLECLRNRFPEKFGFFDPLDWRTDAGIDCIVKSGEPGEICRFVEFKKDLTGGRFNHTFTYIHYIVCWQVKCEEGSVLEDPARHKWKLMRHEAEEYDLPDTAPWTLEGDQKTIKVYSLRDILIEKLNVKVVNTA